MDAEDSETLIVHYALQKLHILPSVFCAMEQEEKAFVIASIEKRVEAEKKQERNFKKPGTGKRRRKR